MIDIETSYLSGVKKLRCTLRIADQGVGLFLGKKSGAYGWPQVRRIGFDDPGRTKANVGAILAFGVLGLAGRRAFTIITLATDSEDLYFESELSIAQWRVGAMRIPEVVPAAKGKVYVDGQSIDVADTGPELISAGWHPDPLGMPQMRWHDGSRWTDHTTAMPTLPPPPTA